MAIVSIQNHLSSKAANSKFNGVIFTPSLFFKFNKSIRDVFGSRWYFNKIHDSGFAILGSKLLGKLYDKVSKFFVSKWDCFKIYNEQIFCIPER